MSLSRKLFTDVLVTTAFNFATRLRGIVFIPIISGVLSVAAYGAYTQLLAVTSLLAIVFELGLHASLVRYAQNNKDTAGLYYSLTTFAISVGAVVAIALYAAAIPISRLTLGSTEYAAIFRIGAVLVPLRIWGNMAGNYFRSEMRVKLFSGLRAARAYLSIIGVLAVLLLLGYGLLSVIGVVVIVEVLYVLFLQSLVVRRIGVSWPTFNGFIGHLRYSLPLMGSIIAGNISSRADRLLIGYFFGASAVGIYTIVYQLATALTLFVQPVTTAYFPEFSRLIEDGRIEECLEYHRAGVRYFVGLCLPAVAGLYLVGPQIIELLATEAVADASVVLLPIIGMGIFFFGLDQVYGVLMTASERTATLALTRGSAAIANILLNLALIPEFGIVGAAIATTITYASGFLSLFNLIKRTIDIDFNYIFFAKSGISSMVMVFIHFAIGIENIVLILLFAPIYYILSLFLLNGFKIEEVAEIANAIR
jgi:O-antigen/teichoic acid export membrane protein